MGLDQREPPPNLQVATPGWLASEFTDRQTRPWFLNDSYPPRPLDPEQAEPRYIRSSRRQRRRLHAGLSSMRSFSSVRGCPREIKCDSLSGP